MLDSAELLQSDRLFTAIDDAAASAVEISHDAAPSRKRRRRKNQPNLDESTTDDDCRRSKRPRVNLVDLPLPRKRRRRTATAAQEDMRGEEWSGVNMRCRECEQPKGVLISLPTERNDAAEEFIALTDTCLTAQWNEDSGFDEPVSADRVTSVEGAPSYRLTDFAAHDRLRHLVRFDAGLVEMNREIFFNGVVKHINDLNADPAGGIPARDIGPVIEWWIGGYDDDEAVMGFSTSVADYYLLRPATIYARMFAAAKLKARLAKLVVDLLVSNPDADYARLLNHVRQTPATSGTPPLTEDDVLTNAQFIVNQVASLDEARDEDDPKLLESPCMKTFCKLTGVVSETPQEFFAGAGESRRRTFRRRREGNCHKSTSKATTTPLVLHIYDAIFADDGVLADSGSKGRKKRVEVDEDDDDEDDEDEEDSPQSQKAERSVVGRRQRQSATKATSASFIGDVLKEERGRKYFGGVILEGTKYFVGDHLLITSQTLRASSHVGLATAFWSDTDGHQWAHVNWLERASETVLEDAGDPFELFLVDDCEDQLVRDIMRKVTVIFKTPSKSWFADGGSSPDNDDPLAGISRKDSKDKIFFCQKWYDPNSARFEDPPPPPAKSGSAFGFCAGCFRAREAERRAGLSVGKGTVDDDGDLTFDGFRYDGVPYVPGDCVYLEPGIYGYTASPKKTTIPKRIDKLKKDDPKYPEFYRKSFSDYVKGSNRLCPPPFRVARILKIFREGDGDGRLEMLVRKFYRTEDTHLDEDVAWKADLNLLYWSREEAVVLATSVRGKCTVRFFDPWVDRRSKDAYFLAGSDRFYFEKTYDPWKRRFCSAPLAFLGPKVKSKMKSDARKDLRVFVKKIDSDYEDREVKLNETPQTKMWQGRPLRCLDVFAGCGGLSEGLHQSEIVDTKWAVEMVASAAEAFRLNNPDCVVFQEDCNELLKMVMRGEKTFRGRRLPQKGEVEVLVGGPPCQGFSQLNRWNQRVYSKFKNSLVVSFMSFCDYYRPRFFVLENVRNFVSFEDNLILRTTLRCLLRMGYQCTFGVLQAGSYGVAQTRRRAIIMAAAPGEVLPVYPEPSHAFVPRGLALSVSVGNQRYESCVKRLRSAPLRTMTVRDALSDLPKIASGGDPDAGVPFPRPLSHFQRLVRHRGDGEPPCLLLRDHVAKEFSPLVEARMRHVPTEPGSDWRDLPNISVALRNGSRTAKLRYERHDPKSGRGPRGELRGVCHCAEGKTSEKCENQSNTLIPWCLPHSAHRNHQWSGLYGRLDWDGHFGTTVTDPEPMTKQGRNLHPEQHRVVSIRECARSQGFPDTYMFSGNVMDRYRQVGNAVPPPLARAIGHQIKLAIGASQLAASTNTDMFHS